MWITVTKRIVDAHTIRGGLATVIFEHFVNFLKMNGYSFIFAQFSTNFENCAWYILAKRNKRSEKGALVLGSTVFVG
jgi:hypothetical protein